MTSLRLTPQDKARQIFMAPPKEGEAQTRIVGTQSPKSMDSAKEQLANGLDVVRLNMSYAKEDWTHEVVKEFRQAAQELGKDVHFLACLPGPKARVGDFEGELDLKEGQKFTLTSQDDQGDQNSVSVSHDSIVETVPVGAKVYLKDMAIKLEVTSKNEEELQCKVLRGGKLGPRNGINVPGVALNLPRFPDGDKEKMRWALEAGVDMIMMSNVQDADHVNEGREAAREMGYDPMIGAKPEDIAGLENSPEIIRAADVLMVPRGDMASNTDITKIAAIEELFIGLANHMDKPVIDATDLMGSLQHKTEPDRSEVMNEHAAVRLGAHATMFSGPTANGIDPANAVLNMDKVARQAEAMNRAAAAAGGTIGMAALVMNKEVIVSEIKRIADEIRQS